MTDTRPTERCPGCDSFRRDVRLMVHDNTRNDTRFIDCPNTWHATTQREQFEEWLVKGLGQFADTVERFRTGEGYIFPFENLYKSWQAAQRAAYERCEHCKTGDIPIGHLYHVLPDGSRPTCKNCLCGDCRALAREERFR